MLFNDDSGQSSTGVAWLAFQLIAATFFMGISWIAFDALGFNPVVTFFNNCVGQGWVTKEAYGGFSIIQLIWNALPALAYIGFIAHTIIKSEVLK